MKWIKASERLPEYGSDFVARFASSGKKYICQITDERLEGEEKPDWQIWIDNYSYCENSFHLIEWLDETEAKTTL